MDISDLSDKDGGGWADYGTAGTQTTALQVVGIKAGALVGFTATAPNMVLSSRPKRPSLQSNTSNRGHFVYSEERAKSVVTVPNVSERGIGGIIPTLPTTPENIQSTRSGVGLHGGIE